MVSRGFHLLGLAQCSVGGRCARSAEVSRITSPCFALGCFCVASTSFASVALAAAWLLLASVDFVCSLITCVFAVALVASLFGCGLSLCCFSAAGYSLFFWHSLCGPLGC